MTKKEVPVLLLTGYLGSGKTTLVNHILSNRRGIKFAVIVNDIGEVNIDASLIQKGGVVDEKDDSLVALQNGCICCTLKMNLVEQIYDLMRSERFDYIVIEASGICEPEPIAQTICSIPQLGEEYRRYGLCRLDSVVTVVDALRLQDEFGCGDSLTRSNIDEEDIENLIISQIEFCNMILLNKASEVSPEERERIKAVIRTLQPEAEIIECDYADVDLDLLVNTHRFSYSRVATSAGWIREIEKSEEEIEEDNHCHGHHHDHDDDHECDEHCHEHHHHHHHHDDGGEVEEYGIGTFVDYRRPAFDIHKFDRFVALKWHKNVIRTKGILYFSNNRDMSFLFEQAGKQKQLQETGLWYATASEEEIAEMKEREPALERDWDPVYGDRMIKLVFIGRNLDREALARDLDDCLE